MQRKLRNDSRTSTPQHGLLLTPRWSEVDSNLWSHFEIGTAHAESNDREFVWRALPNGRFSWSVA
jgi:hypothetical protein